MNVLRGLSLPVFAAALLIQGCGGYLDYCRSATHKTLANALTCRALLSAGERAGSDTGTGEPDVLHTRAAGGDADAQYRLGIGLYSHDRLESWKWHCAAARQGHGAGRVAVGSFYELGTEPVSRDSVQAMAWYTLAGDAGKLARKRLRTAMSPGDLLQAQRLAGTDPDESCSFAAFSPKPR